MWRESASADGKEITPEDLRKVSRGRIASLLCGLFWSLGSRGRARLLQRDRWATVSQSSRLATLNNAQVLVKQGSKLSMLVVIQIFLDLGAAYGAWVAGML